MKKKKNYVPNLLSPLWCYLQLYRYHQEHATEWLYISKEEFLSCLKNFALPQRSDSPIFPLGSRLRKHGSSRPLGAWMEALSARMSASVTLPGKETSLQEPTEIWLRFLPSPASIKPSHLGCVFSLVRTRRTNKPHSETFH